MPNPPAPLPSSSAGAGDTSRPKGDDQGITHVLDRDVLGALLDDEEGRILASELIDSFLTLVPDRLRALETALSEADFTECASIAHGLVSTSGTVGAVRLARMLRDVERYARSGNGSDSLKLLAECREEVELARLALIRAID